MDEPLIGEIRPIGILYAPKGWAYCAGQLLPIAQNQALFSLLGTQFGGNGSTTFALPDLRSRIPVGTGQLAGGSTYVQGQAAGTESMTLIITQMPAHTHMLQGTLNAGGDADELNPSGQLPGTGSLGQYSDGPVNAQLGAALTGMTTPSGGNQGHENRQPYIGLNYVIALQGIYPSRN